MIIHVYAKIPTQWEILPRGSSAEKRMPFKDKTWSAISKTFPEPPTQGLNSPGLTSGYPSSKAWNTKCLTLETSPNLMRWQYANNNYDVFRISPYSVYSISRHHDVPPVLLQALSFLVEQQYFLLFCYRQGTLPQALQLWKWYATAYLNASFCASSLILRCTSSISVLNCSMVIPTFGQKLGWWFGHGLGFHPRTPQVQSIDRLWVFTSLYEKDFIILIQIERILLQQKI